MTDRYGLIGWPLEYTHSPELHQRFAQQTGQALTYEAVPVAPEHLQRALRRFVDEGWGGFNATVPHKEAVAAACTSLSPRARQAGAVNTVVIDRSRGTMHGDNTDGAGLVRDLGNRYAVSLRGARILMVGAGGAARGACGPLLDSDCAALDVVNRTPSRANTLVDELRGLHEGASRLRAIAPGTLAESGPYDLVINATSAGLQGEVPTLPREAIRGAFCYDMLYGARTPFADWAGEHGAREVATGLGMLIEQAAEAFALWRGTYPQTDTVFEALQN